MTHDIQIFADTLFWAGFFLGFATAFVVIGFLGVVQSWKLSQQHQGVSP